MNVEVYKGISKKTNKEYECLKISIGVWSKLLFVTPFELHYIKSQLEEYGIDVTDVEDVKRDIEVMFED